MMKERGPEHGRNQSGLCCEGGAADQHNIMTSCETKRRRTPQGSRTTVRFVIVCHPGEMSFFAHLLISLFFPIRFHLRQTISYLSAWPFKHDQNDRLIWGHNLATLWNISGKDSEGGRRRRSPNQQLIQSSPSLSLSSPWHLPTEDRDLQKIRKSSLSEDRVEYANMYPSILLLWSPLVSSGLF